MRQRLLLVLVALALLAPSAMALGAPGSTAAAGEVTVDTWLHGNYVNWLGRWGKDPVSAYFQEKTGVFLNIMSGDGQNHATRLNLMMASNDVPHMVVVPKRDPAAFALQREGFVEDISALIMAGRYPTLRRLLEESNSFNQVYNRFADGNYWAGPDAPLYVWPDFFVDKYTYETQRLNVIQERNTYLARDDIYGAEGRPDLSNIEDFYRFLRTIRDKYVDINGRPIIPLGLMNNGNAVPIFAASFRGSVGPYSMWIEDGVVRHEFEHPGFRDALLFLNRLYRDDLLDPEIYTQTASQWSDKLQAGSVAVVPAWFWHTDAANTVLTAKDPDMFYRSLPAEFVPKSPGIGKPIMNHGWGIGTGFGWRCNMIAVSAPATVKEGAMRFLEYMYGHEAQMMQRYGLPGQYHGPASAWDPANLPRLENSSLSVRPNQAWDQFRADHGVDAAKDSGIWFWSFWNIHGYAEFLAKDAEAPMTTYNREQVLKLSEYDLELAKMADISWLVNSDPAMQSKSNSIAQIRERQFPNIIMAPSEAEARRQYDLMIADMERAGLSDINAEYNRVYEAKMLPLFALD